MNLDENIIILSWFIDVETLLRSSSVNPVEHLLIQTDG